MTNYALIKETTDLVSSLNIVPDSYSTIERQVTDWYNHTDIAETRLLGAAVIGWGYYNPRANYEDIKSLKSMLFETSDLDFEFSYCPKKYRKEVFSYE
jgi:hypothetical protein